jgi:hypothetical protein
MVIHSAIRQSWIPVWVSAQMMGFVVARLLVVCPAREW